jgi:hypothetical protein
VENHFGKHFQAQNVIKELAVLTMCAPSHAVPQGALNLQSKQYANVLKLQKLLLDSLDTEALGWRVETCEQPIERTTRIELRGWLWLLQVGEASKGLVQTPVLSPNLFLSKLHSLSFLLYLTTLATELVIFQKTLNTLRAVAGS